MVLYGVPWFGNFRVGVYTYQAVEFVEGGLNQSATSRRGGDSARRVAAVDEPGSLVASIQKL